MLTLVSSTVVAQPVGRVEAGGWPNVVSSLLVQLANYDVIPLGEAYGRNVELALRLRLIRDPELPRDVSLVVAEFPDDD